jgi:hypothetical protein
VIHMTEQQAEEFAWSYSLVRTDIPNAPPLQLFTRLHEARRAAHQLMEAYPEITFGIFHRGDQLFLGDPAIHEFLH